MILKKKEVAEKFEQFHILVKKSWIKKTLGRDLTGPELSVITATLNSAAFEAVRDTLLVEKLRKEFGEKHV